jgi:hypothetical protein
MKYIVHLIGGESIKVDADRYVINEATKQIDFYTSGNDRVSDLLVFIHGVAAIKEDNSK